jgi:SulP family sulfate permease
MFLIPNIPLNFETLMIILPYSVALAAVGLLGSMMTATIVDEMTDTPSDKHQECKDKVLQILPLASWVVWQVVP